MAEVFTSNSVYGYWGEGNSFYDVEKNLLGMKEFLSKQDKTEIEKIGASIYNLNLNNINNFQAVKATYQNKIPEAIAFMK